MQEKAGRSLVRHTRQPKLLSWTMDKQQRGHVHQSLRQATAAAHRDLDQHRLLRRLTSRELTREQYAESLAAMYRPHAQLERLVHRSRHHLASGLKLSPRLAMLEADLHELNWPVPPISQPPRDPVDQRAAWWGRVYVLEGSRLGSAVIAKCIQSSLCDIAPCHFFGDARIGGINNTLLASLESELEDHASLALAVTSAQAAFAAYQAELDAFDCGSHDIEKR